MNGVARRLQPIRFGENRRKKIRKIQNAREQKMTRPGDTFPSVPVPRPARRLWDSDVLAHAEKSAWKRHAGKFRNHIGQVHKKASDQSQRTSAENPNSSRIKSDNPLAGNDAQYARTSLPVTYSAMVIGISDHSSA